MLIFISFLVMVSAQSNMYPTIHNGWAADISNFPYQVGLRILPIWRGGMCGGSLISNTVIVTAAHCVHQGDRVTAYLGSTYLFEGFTRVSVSITVHSEFNPNNLNNDIALVEIEFVEFTNTVMSIALPDLSDSYPTYESEKVVSSGWGIEDRNTPQPSYILQYAELIVMNNADCAAYYFTGIVQDFTMCAEAPNGASPCGGDSGGPLVHKDTWILVGITSFGPKGNCSYGAGFTRVTEYRQWIQDNSGV